MFVIGDLVPSSALCERGSPQLTWCTSTSAAERGRGGCPQSVLISSRVNGPQNPVVDRTAGRGNSRHVLQVTPQCRELSTCSQLLKEPRAAFREMGTVEMPHKLGLFLYLCLLGHLVQAFCRPNPNKAENLAILFPLNS